LFRFSHSEQAITTAVRPDPIQHQDHDYCETECQTEDRMGGIVEVLPKRQMAVCHVAQHYRASDSQQVCHHFPRYNETRDEGCVIPPLARLDQLQINSEGLAG
jgi:hypothetical protein